MAPSGEEAARALVQKPTHRVQSPLRRPPDTEVDAQRELAQVGDEKVVELAALAVERVEAEASCVVEARPTDPDEARELLLVLGHSGNVEAELIRLLDGAVVRRVAGVVELEDADGRDDHLDRVDRVFLTRRLERLDGAVEQVANAVTEVDDEAVARVGGVSERDARLARRHVVDELWNLVTGVARLLTWLLGLFEPGEAGDTG